VFDLKNPPAMAFQYSHVKSSACETPKKLHGLGVVLGPRVACTRVRIRA